MNELRSLVHIEKIVAIEPIEGADRIELATVLGWKCVVKKDDFKVGDLCVYVEIDSCVKTSFKPFEFLKERADKFGFYHVKTMKLRGVFSQGLVLPYNEFKSSKKHIEGYDLTPEINKGKKEETRLVIHYEEYSDMKSLLGMSDKKRKPLPWFIRWLGPFITAYYARKQRKLIKHESFPSPYSYISKTDEERIQNLNKLFNELKEKKTILTGTEKLDGSSSTYAYINGKAYVASRNMGLYFNDGKKEKMKSTCEASVFWKNNLKYNLLEKVKQTSIKLGKPVVLKGESIANNIQNNPYKLVDEHRFYAFNLIIDGVRCNYDELYKWCKENEVLIVPCVAIDSLDKFESVAELVKFSDGISKLANVRREGIVWRAEGVSFKAVSNEFLLKKGE